MYTSGNRQPATGNRQLLSAELIQAAKNLGHAPRLCGAAARVIRRLGVEDLADRADAGVGQVWFESIEKAQSAGAVGRMDFEPRVDERSDQPRPDRALMIGGIACAEVAVVCLLV